MREDNLLSRRKRKFVVVTTDSGHGRPVYPNLITDLKLTAPIQLWVADITYIRLLEEYVFLAVVLGAFSRRVLGWELGESLQTSLTIHASERALEDRLVPHGVIHHPIRASSMHLTIISIVCGSTASTPVLATLPQL